MQDRTKELIQDIKEYLEYLRLEYGITKANIEYDKDLLKSTTIDVTIEEDVEKYDKKCDEEKDIVLTKEELLEVLGLLDYIKQIDF